MRFMKLQRITILGKGSVQERLDLLFMLNLKDGQLEVGDL